MVMKKVKNTKNILTHNVKTQMPQKIKKPIKAPPMVGMNPKRRKIQEAWGINHPYTTFPSVPSQHLQIKKGDHLPLVSILIASFMRAELLEMGLESIKKQNLTYPYEIIVLNDGIEDKTQDVCDKYANDLPIRYVFTGQRNKNGLVWRIPGYAINIGIQLARGEFIILTEAEMGYLDPNTLNNLITPLTYNKNYIVVPHGKIDDKGEATKIYKQKGLIPPPIYNQLDDLSVVFPFTIALSKEKFMDIGGYDEDFTGISHDDADIALRLMGSGGKYVQIPQRVVHLHHQRLWKKLPKDEFNRRHDYNYSLLIKRAKKVKRNEGKEWGVFQGELPASTKKRITYNNFYSHSSQLEDKYQQIKLEALNRFVKNHQLHSLLDVGCGNGTYIKHLQGKNYTVKGIEMSDVCCNKYLKSIPHICTTLKEYAQKNEEVNEGVICFNTLETLSSEELDEALIDLKKLGIHFLFAITNDSKKYRGQELNTTREKSDWWMHRIAQQLPSISLSPLSGDSLFIIEGKSQYPQL